VATYAGGTERRLYIKPGLTGMWQVSGRSDLDWEEGVRLDLYYVENWSLIGDLQIIWRTVRIMIRPVGAY
jgi:lipopolysaccharide/colanic/teichoic acid biosynthesis glycosyltransferase